MKFQVQEEKNICVCYENKNKINDSINNNNDNNNNSNNNWQEIIRMALVAMRGMIMLNG